MPSIRMLEATLAGTDAPAASDGLQFAAQLDSWSPDALASHVQGYYRAQRNATAAHSRRVNEAARLWADVTTGKLDPVFLREARCPQNPVLVEHLRQVYPNLYKVNGRLLGLRETMAVTDYQALYADVIDRLYYGYFQAWPINNMPLVKKHSLRDFRQVKRYMNDGLVTPFTGSDPGAQPTQSALLGPAPQNGSAVPPTAATSTAAVTYSPWLFQASASINWAAFVNDDLGLFKDVPRRLAIKASRGTHKFITGLYCDVNGPNSSGNYVGVTGAPAASTALFLAGFYNRLTVANGATATNLRLGIQGLMDAHSILAGQQDATGDPIMLGGPMYLVYGKYDYAVAKQLANSLENISSTYGGTPGTSTSNTIGQLLRVRNWAMENLTLIYDPYLSIVASSNPYSWFLVADPDSQERPGIEFGQLAGFEEAQLYSEVPTTQHMGGAPDPTMGNFWSNNQNIKIMAVMGGSAIDGRSWVGSNGSGS